MLRPVDHAYHLRRADEELERGTQSNNETVAAAHFELAHRYSILADQNGRDTDKLTLVEKTEQVGA